MADEKGTGIPPSSIVAPRISDIIVEECTNSKYIKPMRMHFTINHMGKVQRRVWDVVNSHDAVAVLLFHRERQSFLLVKQFRPPVFLRSSKEEQETNPDCGFTYELCAGLIDKSKSFLEIAVEEIMEECGYAVSAAAIHPITAVRGNVGVTGNKVHIYFAEISETAKVAQGGGIEDESIELFYLPVDQAQSFVFDNRYERPASLAYSFFWFFMNFHRDARGQWVRFMNGL